MDPKDIIYFDFIEVHEAILHATYLALTLKYFRALENVLITINITFT
jgi:hypothetical protein